MDGGSAEVNVIVTTLEATRAAVRTAAGMALGPDAQINLIAPQVVPYPLPLGSPVVPVVFTASWLHDLASTIDVKTRIQIFLCRDRREAVSGLVKPKSRLVIGARSRWWPTWEARLARWLRSQGHAVILAPPGKEQSNSKQAW